MQAAHNHVSGAAGTWGHTAPGMPQLVLVADGTLHGTDGCNRLMGSWREDADHITFMGVAATRMFCPDVDDWLSAMATAKLEPDALYIFNASGHLLGVLQRSGSED